MAVQIDVRANAEQAQRSLDKLNNSVKNIETSAQSVNESFKNLNKVAQFAAAAITAAFTGSAITRAADSYKRINTQLKLATTNANQLLVAQRNVNRLAIETRSNLESSASLYARLNNTAIKLNRSQRETVKATRAISQAIQISGTSAASAQAAIIQLGQGLASGTLRGEELNSVLEQAPRIAKALADELDVSVGELRKLASEGKLTSSTVFNALVNQSAQINKEFQSVSLTVSQATTILNTGINTFVASLDRSLGLSDGLAKRIVIVGSALNDFGNEFEARIDILEARLLVFRIQLVRAFKQGVNTVKEALTGLININDLKVESQKIVNALSNIDLSGISFDFNLSSFDSLMKGIQDGVKRLKSAYSDIETFVHGVMDLFYEAYDDIVGNSTWTDTIDGIESGAKYLVETVLPEITRFVDSVKDLFKSIVEADFGKLFQDAISAAILNLNFGMFAITDFSESLATEVKTGIEQGVASAKDSLNNFSEGVGAVFAERGQTAITPEKLPAIIAFDNYLKDAGEAVSLFGDTVSAVVDTLGIITEQLGTIDIALIVAGFSLLSQRVKDAVGATAAPGAAIAQAITDRSLTPRLESRTTEIRGQRVASEILAGFDGEAVRSYNEALAAQAEITNSSKESIKALGGALNAADSRVQANIESLRQQAGVSQEVVEELRKYNSLTEEQKKSTKLSGDAQRLQAVAADRARTSAAQLAEAEQRLSEARARAEKRTAALIQGTRDLFSNIGGAGGAAIGFTIARDFIEVIERDIGDIPGWGEAGINIAGAFLGQITGQVIGTAIGTVIGTAIASALATASALTAAGSAIASGLLLVITGLGSSFFFPESTLIVIESVFGKGARDFAEKIGQAFKDGSTIVVTSIIKAFQPIIDFFDKIFGSGSKNTIGGQSQQTRDNLVKALENLRGQDPQTDPVISKAITAITNNNLTNKEVAGQLNRLNTNNEGLRQTLSALAAVLDKTPTEFASGGRVSGPGTGTSDSIPAMLSNGEYVINAAAARKLGLHNLDMLNNGQLPRFSPGGPVGGSSFFESVRSFVSSNASKVDNSLTSIEAITAKVLALLPNVETTVSNIDLLVSRMVPMTEALPEMLATAEAILDNVNDAVNTTMPLLGNASSTMDSASKLIDSVQSTVDTMPVTINHTLNKVNDTIDSLKDPIGSATEVLDRIAKGDVGFAGRSIFGQPQKKARGGSIRGPGTGTSDSIPAMLSNGEFVVNAKATSRNLGLLSAINGGMNPGGDGGNYGFGGYVDYIDKNFIKLREGKEKLKGYVPKRRDGSVFGRSGVTIASGVDLGQFFNSELIRAGVPKSLAKKLKPYESPLIKEKAVKFLEKNPLSITLDEAKILDKAIANYALRRLSKYFSVSEFSTLPKGVATALASYTYQYGSLKPNFGQLAKARKFKELAKAYENETKYSNRRKLEANLIRQSFASTALPKFTNNKTKVKKGEGGVAVALREGISFARLKKANPGIDMSKLEIGQILNLASGGRVTGPGTGKSDSIPAMLSNGEFVVNAESASRYRGILDQINAGTLASFSGGTPRSTSAQASSTKNVVKQLEDLTGKTISTQEYSSISKAEQNTVKAALSAIEVLNLEAKEADAIYAVELQESIERLTAIIEERLFLPGTGENASQGTPTPGFAERVFDGVSFQKAGEDAGQDFVNTMRKAIIESEGGGIKQITKGFLNRFTESITNQFFDSLSTQITGIFSKDGGLDLDEMISTLGSKFSSLFGEGGSLMESLSGLGSSISSVFSNLGSLGSAGGGGAGIFSSISSLFGGFFADGGVVPGQGPVPIIAHGGEVVLNQEQQAALFDKESSAMAGANVTVNLQVVGDVSRQTREEVVGMLPEIADNTQRVFNERRLLNGAR